jgi:hypothetical protein
MAFSKDGMCFNRVMLYRWVLHTGTLEVQGLAPVVPPRNDGQVGLSAHFYDR